MANAYALGQLSKAFVTATNHEDPEVRSRADARVQRWIQTLDGLASGSLRLGSRTPAAGLPAWVTLEVVRGGFATGRAAAEGDLEPDELSLAARAGVPAERRYLFAHHLTHAGVAELEMLLDAGTYRIELPEDAALLTVAWLVRTGDRAGALELLDTMAPYADRLRFTPRTAVVAATPPGHVYRITAGQARTELSGRQEHREVEAQRETLAVWNSFADQVLGLWWSFLDGGELRVPLPDGWRGRAQAMLEQRERLARLHTRCAKHRRPKENLAILLRGLQLLLDTGNLPLRELGLVRVAVDGMTRKRGTPGSAGLLAVRDGQARIAAIPAHRTVAALAAARLAGVQAAEGIPDLTAFTHAVTATEAVGTGLPADSAMPPSVRKILARAHSAPVETLIEKGVVPSADVLAALVPGITATVVAAGFSDERLARLMAANYRAFRRRRSLLLLNLEKQVQITELPWVRAVAAHGGSDAMAAAQTVARRVGALAVDHFPGRVLPNPLVRELDHLLRAGALEMPLVEELAADIFMGRFSDKFRRAAAVAAPVIAGTVYAAYYDIDCELIGLLQSVEQNRLRPWHTAIDDFSQLCRERARFSDDHSWSVAANGTVIEQAQILTTHNLAALVEIGARPTRTWIELADTACANTAALLALAARQPHPLATVKDAAYAWRQAVFFLSLGSPGDVPAFLDRARHGTEGSPALAQILRGLEHVADGGRFHRTAPAPAADASWAGRQRHLGSCPRQRRCPLNSLAGPGRSVHATGRRLRRRGTWCKNCRAVLPSTPDRGPLGATANVPARRATSVKGGSMTHRHIKWWCALAAASLAWPLAGCGGDGDGDKLAEPSAAALRPAYSPDGTKIAFTRVTDDGRVVYLMNADGTDPQTVTPLGGELRKGYESPAFSPDGKQLVVAGDVGGIFVIGTDGTGLKALVEDDDDDYEDREPTFSPDGTKIAWLRTTLGSTPLEDGSDLVSPEETALWIMDADGSSPKRLGASGGPDQVGPPAFSPDGKKIAYVVENTDAKTLDRHLWVMNADGTGAKALTSGTDNSDWDPSFSPDERKIVFAGIRRPEILEVYAMDADGADPVQLTTGGTYSEDPSYSPDGKQILFTSQRSGSREVWVMNADGTGQRPLTTYTPRSAEVSAR